jgi:hypothetical protein
MMQRPGATDVAGFQQWKKEGRSVKKGEKALQILAPTNYTKKVKQAVLNPDGSKATDKDGNVQYRYEDKRMKGFTLVSVFDKSQTQGKEEERPIDILKNTQLGAVCLKDALAEYSDIPIIGEKGTDITVLAELKDDSIVYNTNMEEKRTIAAVVQAFTEHLVNGLDKEYTDEEKNILTNCIGYIITNHYGADTTRYDFSNIDEYVENLAPTNSAGVSLPKEARIKELLTEAQKQSSSIIKELTPKFNRNYVLDRALDIAEQTAYFMEAYDFYNILDSVEGANETEIHKNTVDEIYSEFLDLSKHETILDYFDDFEADDLIIQSEKDGILGQIKFVLELIKQYKDELGIDLEEKQQEIPAEDIPTEKLAEGFEAVDTATEEVPFDDIEDISVRVKAALQKTTNFRELAKLGPSDEVFPTVLAENPESFLNKDNLNSFYDLKGENMVWEYIDAIPEVVTSSQEKVISFLENIKDIDLEALDNEFGHTLGLTQIYNKILNLAEQYQMNIPSELLVERTKTAEDIPTEEQPKSEEKAIEEPSEETPELPKEEAPSEEPKAEAPKKKSKKTKEKAEETADSKKLQDFGEKIGGAKKDLWKSRGLALSDLEEMNSAELDKFIKKDNVWIKPDYQKLVDDGLDVTVAYFYKQVRDSLPTRPFITSRMSDEEIAENQERYVTFVSELRDAVYTCKTEEAVKRFYEDTVLGKGFLEKSERGYSLSQTDKSKYLLENKQLKAMRVDAYDISKMKREIAKKKFCYSEEQKLLSNYMIRPYSSSTHKFETTDERTVVKARTSGGTEFFYPDKEGFTKPEDFEEGTFYVVDKYRDFVGKNFETYEEARKFALEEAKKLQQASPEVSKDRKKSLIPPQLEAVKRVGPSVREGDVTGQDYLDDFKIKGGEFGNWLNDKDRQASVNFAYEAFRDLATVLNIPDSDIGLNGNLSIAFGARGSGSALAHYEPLREVINLTKMKGAGSLAHEYCHALDDRIATVLGISGFATEHAERFKKDEQFPESIVKLVEIMKYKEVEESVASETVQTIQHYDSEIKEREKNFYSFINYYLPDKYLTEEQQAKRDELVKAAFASTTDPMTIKSRSSMSVTYKSAEVDAIADFKKEVLGGSIPSKDRKGMAHNLSTRLHYIQWKEEASKKLDSTEVVKKRVTTKFFEDAKTIDREYSKSGHGYWQSTLEMAARAFACYVDDKLKEQGIRNDYLTGHANSIAIPHTTNDGKTEIIRAYPVDEERKVINQAFDAVIIDLKKLGILHEKEVPKEIEKEKEVEKKQKQTKSKGPKL